MPKIPLGLITGFLGSGKTTFLKHTARRLASRRVVYLVNEFSALDVDGAALRQIGPNVVSVPGGSIFCKCLVSEFILHLSEIPRRFAAEMGSALEKGTAPVSRSGGCTFFPAGQHAPEKRSGWHGPAQQGHGHCHQVAAPSPALEGVIIEASGIANPKVVADMLRETKLDAIYNLASIVAVVDPGSFRKLLVTLPNIRAQVEAADIVLLNKIDLFGEKDTAATEDTVRQINPRARVIRTTRGATDVGLFGESPSREGLHGEYAPCADPHYGRFGVRLSEPVDLAKLRAALQDLGEDLYRAKGFVPTFKGMVRLDYSMAGLSMEACEAPEGVEAGLAMIVRADREDRMERWLDEVGRGMLNVRS